MKQQRQTSSLGSLVRAPRPNIVTPAAQNMPDTESIAAQLAAELQKNRELTKKLYLLRGEPPPNDTGDDHSNMGEPPVESRPRSWEVYASMQGIDSLFTGLSKRTPCGAFFTS